jgi:mannitol/fructose-specific phosphotransferase system IIA component (Ntr-type)
MDLDRRCVALELAATGKREVIAELISLAASAGLIADAGAAESAILAREALMTTGIGQGVALPHALIPGFGRTVLAVGRSRKGIDFQALDGAPVRLVVLIVGAKGQEPFHLVLLSRLARILGDEQVRRRILDASTAEELALLLEQ